MSETLKENKSRSQNCKQLYFGRAAFAKMPPKRKVITRKVKDDHISDHEDSGPEDLQADVKIEVKEEPIFASEQVAPEKGATPERVGIDDSDGGGIISSEEEDDDAANVLKENISPTIIFLTKIPLVRNISYH